MPAGYYQVFFIRRDHVQRLFGDLLEARSRFLAAGATAQATEVARVFAATQAEFKQIERDITALATQRIRDKINQSAKRPAGGASGEMASNVLCEPIPSYPSIAGVGIAKFSELDKTVNPNRTSQTPYWRAQEYGYAGAVGRELHGLYFNAGFAGRGVPANPADFRVHPLFRAMAKGPPMKIRNAIQARHFLRDGAGEAEAAWRLRIRVADSRCARALAPLIRGAPAALSAAERKRAAERTRTKLPTRFPRRF
jgi:hypothetical protein